MQHDYLAEELDPGNSRFATRREVAKHPQVLELHRRVRAQLFPDGTTDQWVSKYAA